MKPTENQLIIGRRNALKFLGLGSAALFTKAFGAFPAAEPVEMEVKAKPMVSGGPSRVAFATGTDRKTIVAEVMSPFEKEIRQGIKGKQLIIKPNMVSTSRPLCATHVDALRGLIDFVKPFYKGPIVIAEGCAGNGDSSPGFKNYGYLDLQKDYNLKFVDINLSNGSPFWIVDKDVHLQKILITDLFLDPKNYVISISRLKTHNYVVMTAGTKNMVMGAPLNIPAANGKPQINHKFAMHAGGPRWLHYNMFLVAKRVRANFTIIDGVEGMEGNGPSSGTAVDHKIALAGYDSIAIDSICARLMGIPLENVGYLNYCAENGLGVVDRDKIDIIGGKNPDQFIKQYKLHDTIEMQLQWKDPLKVG